MKGFLAGLIALLALGWAAPADAAGCGERRCKPTTVHRRLAARASGRVITPVPAPTRARRQAPLPRADFTERPVLPGQEPVPAFLPNTAPPVFAPQPLR